MARAQTIINRFDLSGGFLTEFTELTFPENVTVDELNFTLEPDGSRKRRLGIDYEEGYELADIVNPALDVVHVMEWRNAGGLSTANFIVVQAGAVLHFYENGDTISTNKIAGTVDMIPFKTSFTDIPVKGSKIDGAYGRTRFFVVGEFLEPFYIEWDGTSFTATQIAFIERDFEGAEEAIEITDRPSTLTVAHNYNLRNQGWPDNRISEFETGASVYPSNADIWHFGLYVDSTTNGRRAFDWRQLRDQDFGNTPAPKGRLLRNIFNTTTSFNADVSQDIFDFDHTGLVAGLTTNNPHNYNVGDTIVIDSTSFTYIDNDAVAQSYTYNKEAFTVASVPNASELTFSHNIANFDVSDPDASFGTLTTAGLLLGTINNPSGEEVEARPTCVAFFAGRTWWSGIPEDRLSNKVYFSKTLEFSSQIGECYQEADPTSEHISEIIDTDGGVLTISEMGQVRKMGVVGKNLVLFADNGVWNIGPGNDGYFTPTSFSIRKISDVVVCSPRNVLFAEGIPLVWTYQGIYGFSEDQVSGSLTPQSISHTTIQSFYRDIPDECKAESFGVYDDVAKVFYWGYSSDPDRPNVYDNYLLYDTRRQSFIKYQVAYIKQEDPPLTAIGPVVVGLIPVLGYDDPTNKIKFCTLIDSTGEITFSNLRDTTFTDWPQYTGSSLGGGLTGEDAHGYLVTSYEAGQDIARDKQTPFITFIFKRTEAGTDANGNLINPGSCFMQARWDWSNSSNSNKWNPERQVYKIRRTYHPGSHPASTYDDGHPVVWSRNKVRGRGRALNFKLRTEAGHDCHLLGWQITMTGNTET